METISKLEFVDVCKYCGPKESNHLLTDALKNIVMRQYILTVHMPKSSFGLCRVHWNNINVMVLSITKGTS